MSNRSNEGRRPTKAERKEQARLEREALQRQMASRKRNRTIGMALVALAAVAVIAAVVVLRPGDTNAALPAPSELLDQAADESQASACDAVQTTGFYDGFDQSSPEYADQAHVEGDARFPALPPLETYASTPPASGPHTGSATMPAGVYGSPPDLGTLLHSLEHGGTVVWHSPDAPPEQMDAIEEFYEQSDPVGQDRVIVAPYDYDGPAGQLPDGVEMALVGWRRLQLCGQPSLAVAFDFTSQYSFPTTQDREYAGEAPERGAAI